MKDAGIQQAHEYTRMKYGQEALNMKITVVGLGYVGLACATLLARKNKVVAIDLDQSKVQMVNARKSPIVDIELQNYFSDHNLNLSATSDKVEAYEGASYVVVATPTNFNVLTSTFDTSSVEAVIADVLQVNEAAVIVIKSTIPVGFVDSMRLKFNTDQIIFSPEFLREGRALYDNLHPSRIIVGEHSGQARIFANLLREASLETSVPVLFTGTKEAEAIKLFANTYLAMRVAFFNELDNLAISESLDSQQIIDGVCFDPRIGTHYNNPSFGYGGYCLPKDTKQLLFNFRQVPHSLIQAIIESNDIRKDFLTEQILLKKPMIVGVFRLEMKVNSDNFRDSAILGIMNRLHESGVELIIHEPRLTEDTFDFARVVHDIDAFKAEADLIITNRNKNELLDVAEKVFTRDLYGED
jgi:UDPglucose 6-dehydrogenase